MLVAHGAGALEQCRRECRGGIVEEQACGASASIQLTVRRRGSRRLTGKMERPPQRSSEEWTQDSGAAVADERAGEHGGASTVPRNPPFRLPACQDTSAITLAFSPAMNTSNMPFVVLSFD